MRLPKAPARLEALRHGTMDMPMLDDLGPGAGFSARVLVELAVLAVCVAWPGGWWRCCSAACAPGDPRSILILGPQRCGRRAVPAVLLSLAYIARTLLHHWDALAVFKIAIPVLVALVVIRIGVKVLQVAYPDAAWVRPSSAPSPDGVAGHGAVGHRAAAAGAGRAGPDSLEGGRGDAVGAHHHRRGRSPAGQCC